MSAESRALVCEVMRASWLDWREEDIMVDEGTASDLAYHTRDQKSKSEINLKERRLLPSESDIHLPL